MSDFQIGSGFVAHYEREGGGVGDRMGGGVVRKFCHRKEFRRVLFRSVGDISHGQGWKVVPRCLPMGDSLPIGRGIVGGRRSPDGR